MILKALYDYAHHQGLVEDMAVRARPVHLVLHIGDDGRPVASGAWEALSEEVPDPKKPGRSRTVDFRVKPMPEYPGVNAGGKAHFLADSAEKVLGVSAKTGEAIGPEAKNAAKAFEHYWTRIADAFGATKDAELAAMLRFRDLFLAGPDRASALAALVGVEPFGKEGRPTVVARTPTGPVPIDGKTVTFQVGGALSLPVFDEGSPLVDYWREQFRRERFTEAPADGLAAGNLGYCLVTGSVEAPAEVPIAEVHRTTIKGVPGLPPIGGYVVSFDKSTPSLRSYGFEGGFNAPVSEDAAAAYALGLNHILSKRDLTRKINDAVLCSWVNVDPTIGGEVLTLLNQPTKDATKVFFEAFADGGKYHPFLSAGFYRSLTLAANGGRVVVRRWLDEPLKDAIRAVRAWFDDLDIEAVEVPPKKAGKGMKATAEATAPAAEPSFHPLSIYALAAATARVPSEVRDGTYDALYRAALDPSRFNPASLLAPALQRLKIAAAERGNGVRFETQRFALVKLILNRSGDPAMAAERILCETNDRAYNCGRLLAVLDDLQRAAQGNVGADVVSRFYGAASTYPRNVFGRLLDLAQVHRKKLSKSPNARLRSKGWALGSRVRDISALILPEPGSDVPEFPGQLSPAEQGRFALGFQQQKAADERAIKAYLDARAAGQATDDPTLDALADDAAVDPD